MDYDLDSETRMRLFEERRQRMARGWFERLRPSRVTVVLAVTMVISAVALLGLRG